MGGRLDATTEKKLDMALDDLVDKRKEQDPESDEDRRPPHKERHEQSGPYSRGDGKGRGQSGKKGPYRKVPLEEKALLHTDCFFNADGDFVVKLYDTEVFILKKRPEALDVDGKPSAGSPPPGVVLVLTSGKYRTIETKYIINEALQSFSMRVSEGDDSNWTVVGESTSQPFEDGMQVQVTAPLVRASVVKQHLADKIQDAKSRGAARADPATRGHHRRGGDYEPHMPPAPPGHWAPPSTSPAQAARLATSTPCCWTPANGSATSWVGAAANAPRMDSTSYASLECRPWTTQTPAATNQQWWRASCCREDGATPG